MIYIDIKQVQIDKINKLNALYAQPTTKGTVPDSTPNSIPDSIINEIKIRSIENSPILNFINDLITGKNIEITGKNINIIYNDRHYPTTLTFSNPNIDDFEYNIKVLGSVDEVNAESNTINEIIINQTR